MRKRSTLAAAITILLATVSMPFLACSSSPSPQEAKANFCTSLDGFHQSVSTLQTVGPGTSVDEVKSDVNDVRSSFQDVQNKATDVKGANTDSLQSAVNDLRSAVSDVSGSATLADALASIQTQLSAVAGAWQQLETTFQCS